MVPQGDKSEEESVPSVLTSACIHSFFSVICRRPNTWFFSKVKEKEKWYFKDLLSREEGIVLRSGLEVGSGKVGQSKFGKFQQIQLNLFPRLPDLPPNLTKGSLSTCRNPLLHSIFLIG
jgi:hypothetical protein